MEDSASQQHNERGVMPEFDIRDYITSNTDGEGNQLDIFAEFQQHPSTPSQMNMETSQNILGSHNSMEYTSQAQPQSMMVAEMLKGRLEQQMKLQQLQQLQNHILQQQIELISGQSSLNNQQKDNFFHGLLTPGPSTELRAMVSKDLVSPMMLQQDMYINNPSDTTLVDQLTSHRHDMSMSAPAALAFQTSPPFPLPSPAEPEYDLSPLTSPWLLPVSAQQQSQQQHPRQSNSEHSQSQPRLKRAVSSSRDEQSGMRKRTSPNMHPVASHARHTGTSGSPASSSTSTSPITATEQISNSGKLGLVNDTPSPVDLSMPPPAPPASSSHPSFSSTSSSTSLNATPSTSASPTLSPVTPASIMNLQGLPTGLVPSHFNGSNTADGMQRRTGRSKSAPKTKPTVANVANGVVTRGRRGSVAKPGISPNLKPILPGAISTSPLSPLAQPSHFPHGSSGFGSPSLNGIQGPRKTSHKAAEQKRRDSLKTSFDELRLLLPPVPLPDDAGDEPPLPGSMPPRGPPKGDADGPNRGVSKLALLRCGNTYIRDLKGKVVRRDTEIERLRAEVRRLRTVTGDPDGLDLDLERDVDEGEYYVGPVGGYGEDGDEDVE